MPQAKYQLEDFLALVETDYKDFALTINEMMVQKGYKPKIQLTKSYGLHVSYWQPRIKSVIGIIVYLLVQNGKLKIRINADNYANYLDVFNRLPENILNQMDKADDCMKVLDPQKCWQGCIGYDFHIGEKHYQKCLNNCFMLDVDSDSFPFLIELIECESKERSVACA